jgi:Protein of unknown function (DUF3224)
MSPRPTRYRGIALCLLLCTGAAVGARTATSTVPSTSGAPTMSHHAKGSFDVQVTPQPNEDGVGAPGIGRLGLFKQLHGDMEGTARGQMLAVRTPVEGSAGYVAIDHVEVTLAGRKGTFALQHSGTMGRGQTRMDIRVVPDSGTGELTGIDGTFAITITDGKHYYDFEYTLPPAR